MDFKTAIGILELDPNNITGETVKKAYRFLSKKYHPDVSGNNDGSKFILVNAAYEFLLKNLSIFVPSDFEETEDELRTRISAIEKAFNHIEEEYISMHNKIFEGMVNQLVYRLNYYSSYKKLQNNINNEFVNIVDSGVHEILNWFNGRIEQITTSYDDWINGYLRSTYEKLKEDEFNTWYKSKIFYKHFILSNVISLLIVIVIIFSAFNPYYTALAIIPFVLGITFYFQEVKDRYSFKSNIKNLDPNKFKIDVQKLYIKNNDGTSMGKSALGIGAVGAMIGSIGGPLGAIVGGAIGGFIGSLFGESIDELREKLFERMIPKLEEVESTLLTNLQEQVPKIQEELIKSIQDNFQSNKLRAVKLLLKE